MWAIFNRSDDSGHDNVAVIVWKDIDIMLSVYLATFHVSKKNLVIEPGVVVLLQH